MAARKQRLAYALVALAMAILAAAAIGGGLLLHHAADIERQALRTQKLANAAFRLHELLTRVETTGRIDAPLSAELERRLKAADDAYSAVQAHDESEARRLRLPYDRYVRTSTHAFADVRTDGVVPAVERSLLERRLAALESRIDLEIQHQAHASRVTNPKARLALIIAVAAAAILVGLLIWQFEMQRRSGRIDRDNARRTEELVRLKDQFVASVSHELRTPLTSILGYLAVIRESAMGADGTLTEERGFLEIVGRNADRLLRLVSDLLLVAEVDGGTLALRLGEVDLGALASQCVQASKLHAEARQISLALIEESPARLAADSTRLAQMMDNVVSNAIKFTPVGGRVTVTTGSRDGYGVFEVEDTGPGIAAADRSQLFDPFFRTETAVSEGVKGTGLGLTITKAIVDAHRGSIEVASAPGSGTTFHIELPRTGPSGGRGLTPPTGP